MLLGLIVMSDGEPALAAIMKRNASMLRAMLGRVLGHGPEAPTVDLLLALLWGLGIHEFLLQEGDAEALLERAFDAVERSEGLPEN